MKIGELARRTGLRPDSPLLPPITWNNKVLASLANMAEIRDQLRKLNQGRKSASDVSPAWALLVQQLADLLPQSLKELDEQTCRGRHSCCSTETTTETPLRSLH